MLFHTLEHTTAEWRQQELSRRREAVAKQQARREAGAKAAIQIPPRPGRRLGEAITPAQEKAAALQRMVASGQEAALSPLEYSERRLGIKRASDAYDAQAVAGFLRTSPDAPREVRERSTTSLASTVRRHYLSHSLPAVSKHSSPAASSGAAASAAGRSRSRSPAAERRPSAERDDRDAPSEGGEAEGDAETGEAPEADEDVDEVRAVEVANPNEEPLARWDDLTVAELAWIQRGIDEVYPDELHIIGPEEMPETIDMVEGDSEHEEELTSDSEFQTWTPMIAAVQSGHRLLVDSGATATVFRRDEFESPVDPRTSIRLNSIRGDPLKVHGKQAPISSVLGAGVTP